ncbi:MAG: N-acetylneuraminate synthase family protein [Candidatus Aenigmarchaeota archaeon]|nr:N-acetylneuraminate synthase family protein [Candidatus Aenigmarchaeota archaeon]
MQFKIGKRMVGDGCPCFIIAEAGVNHNGELALAKKLVDAAVNAGVDAVKFQTYISEYIATKRAEQAEYQKQNMGRVKSQYDMLKELELSYDDFHELKKYCDKKSIIFLSTPHSCADDVDLVASLCPAIKVSSPDLTNLPILKYMASKGLPIILATGMGNMEEVREAVNIITPMNRELILLHATTNYPTPLKEVNLKAMNTMAKEFILPVGYSDHTNGINVAVAAVALGACVIEKHFTLNREMKGPDHKASLEPGELKQMVQNIRKTEKMLRNAESAKKIVSELNVTDALGDGIKKPAQSELKIMKNIRKSIVAAVDVKKGDIITEHNLAIKRPGTGLQPKYYWSLLGKAAKRKIKKDELLSMKDFV